MKPIEVKPFHFLKYFFEILHHIMDQNLIDLGHTLVEYSSIDSSVFWNCALVNRALTEKELEEVEKIYEEKDRDSTVCFEKRPDFDEFIEFLLDRDYKKAFEDSWLFHDGSGIREDNFDLVKKVETEEDLKVFLGVFYKSYGKDDSQNPYGDQLGYLPMLRLAWESHHVENSMECFIVFKDGKAVAVGTLNNYEKVGYISNIGSLPEVRGQGFGKLITLFCVNRSQQRGNTIHALATEEGTYPDVFYKRLGFKQSFRSVGYSYKRES